MDNHELTSRLANLSPAKRALLEQKLKQHGVTAAIAQAIPRKAERLVAPLSFAQQRLWFLSQLEPNSSSYNESNGIRLVGPLDTEALRHALNKLTARHEVLRTTIAVMDGHPHQVIQDPSPVDLPVVDMRGMLPDRREAEAYAAFEKIARRPFDLSRDLPLRALLVRLDDQEHILFKVIHHIASDGWSSGILWRELGQYYREARSGTHSDPADLPIQYQDYAAWQRDWLQGEILETQLSYWRKQLKDIPELQLCTDNPRTPGQKSPGAKTHLDLDPDLADALKQLSKAKGLTLFMTFLAACQVLLHRYTGQDDIAVGSPIAGRTRPEVEGLIGFFVNTMVLRMDLSNDPTFEEVLAQARDVALGAYAHQELPFERIVEELNPKRDLNTTPLFRVMFAYQNAPRVPAEFAGLETIPVEVPSGEAKFDMFLAVLEKNHGLSLRLDYAADLFHAASMDRLLGNLQTLLKSLVDHPDQRISKLALLTAAERHQQLVAWNAGAQDYPQDQCIHELFEDQARKTPEAVAVISPGRQLTYRELNRRANRLAHYLREQGVGPETAVAVCMERSIEVVVGLLGILKAGGAYVPVDPTYPAERLLFMLEDSQAQFVLADRRAAELPAVKQQARVLRLDSDWQPITEKDDAIPDNRAAPNGLAYVIYTSGSTGTPKGVMGHHRGLVNRLSWMWSTYPFQQGEVCCQKTSLSFVDSLAEILGPLLRGIPTVILGDLAVKDPAELIANLASQRISRIVLVPSLLRALLDDDSNLQDRLPHLRLWVSSGEPLTKDVVKLFRRRLPKARLINLYGSSEVAADATYHEVTRDPDESLPVLIGRPIHNTKIYILDAKCQPVPVGVTGELYVGGDGIAHGYLNQDDLTAEKFIDHGFDGETSRRLFRTGDFARYRSDGNIEFLGRIDNQVKIRGYRIELGEIESVLSRHPAVRECVVVGWRENESKANSGAADANPQSLVAYIVPGNDAPARSELSTYLKAKLPEYMIPSSFMLLQSLPLTANGKLDRRALPRPDQSQLVDQSGYVGPRTATEKMLAAVWADVLGMKRVSLDDNFFAIGGHSLLVVGLFARIKKLTGRNLPLSTLFKAPTIAQLAEVLDRDGPKPWSSTLVPVRSGGSRPPFFCLHGAWGSVVFGAELARRLSSDQPFYGLEAPGLDGEQEPFTRIQDMAAHHVREMRRVQPEGPYYLGGLSMGGLVAFEIARQLVAQQQTVALLALIDTHRPLRSSRVHQWSNRARRLLVDDIFGRVVFHGRNFLQGGSMWSSTYAREKTRMLGKRIANQLRLDHQGNQAYLGDIYAVKVRKANLLAMRRYEAQSYPGRITLLTTIDSPVRKHDGRKGWGELAAGGLEVIEVPGDHNTMISETHIGTLAEKLGECLQKAQASSTD